MKHKLQTGYGPRAPTALRLHNFLLLLLDYHPRGSPVCLLNGLARARGTVETPRHCLTAASHPEPIFVSLCVTPCHSVRKELPFPFIAAARALSNRQPISSIFNLVSVVYFIVHVIYLDFYLWYFDYHHHYASRRLRRCDAARSH